MTAEEALATIDNLLLKYGYDSFRSDQSKDYEKVVDAFQDFCGDWKRTKTGELRDRIDELEAKVS